MAGMAMNLTRLIGLILIIGGIFIFAYQRISYTKPEEIMKVGDVRVTAETEKTVYFSPWVGGVAMLAGLVLVLVPRRK
jgi:hypothetical protein